MQRILLTGASGGIGARLRRLLPRHYPDLLLSDLRPPDDLKADERFVAADLADADAIRAACADVHGIVHLGGHSVEGSWDAILRANIVGCINLFEAARQQGVRRIVFASSNHVMGFHPRNRTIGVEALALPDSRYGASKLFGEGLGALYACKYGIGVLSIRIGNVADSPADARRLATWLHPDDLVKLIRIGLERPGLVHETVYGMSDNARAWWDNRRAVQLGYRPEGQAEQFADAALAAERALPPDPVGDMFQGGPFCSAEFEGDPARLKPPG